MANNVELRTFPSTRADALTMLFLQKQDLKDVSEHDLVAKYIEVKRNIEKELRAQCPSGVFI
jgi:hypothetical protein